MNRRKQVQEDWRETEAGRAKYEAARAEAQAKANELGFDYGIERNDVFKEYRVFMLPRRENRYGHEARCEVVHCEKLERVQPGHGPGHVRCGWQGGAS